MLATRALESGREECSYKLILTSHNLCRDVTKYCSDVNESIDFFWLRYCQITSSHLFLVLLVSPVGYCLLKVVIILVAFFVLS